jgi:hypothetical protein
MQRERFSVNIGKLKITGALEMSRYVYKLGMGNRLSLCGRIQRRFVGRLFTRSVVQVQLHDFGNSRCHCKKYHLGAVCKRERF